jgi:hypothetical protein
MNSGFRISGFKIQEQDPFTFHTFVLDSKIGSKNNPPKHERHKRNFEVDFSDFTLSETNASQNISSNSITINVNVRGAVRLH